MRPTLTTGAHRVSHAILLLALVLLFECRSAQATWAIGLGGTRTGEARATAAPPAPAGVAAACVSSSGTTVKVTWTAVTLASTYKIWKSTTSATSGFSVTATGVTGTSWTSATLAAGGYWFEVSALVGANWATANSVASAKRTITVTTCS